MLNVLLSRRWGSSSIWLGAIGCLSGALLLVAPIPTLAQDSPQKTRPSGAEKSKSAKTKPAASDDDEAPAPAPDTAPSTSADPSQTRKVIPIEIFKDPAIEQLQLLDLKKFKQVVATVPTANEVLVLKEMARNVNVPVDVPLIDRVVRGLAARLTDPKGIKALIEPPPDFMVPEDTANKAARKKAERELAVKMEANAEAAKVIPKTTSDLLEPLFTARAAGNKPFLKAYERSLKDNLPILLSNHLVPRVQAMIVLGEAGSLDAIDIYKREITNPRQSLWVKLWALEGITKIKQHGEVLTTDDESRASKIISDFLDKNEDLPWPIQLRSLEAMAALRQGFLPTAASKVHMATTAMHFLADTQSRVEVRAEAARALGMMQISNSVPKFNFYLVAHSAALLGADLAAAINALYFEGSGTGKEAKPPRAENDTKAKYLAALLIGPVYQCFDGLPSMRDSGLLRMAPTTSRPDILKTFSQIKEISQSVVDLMGSAPKQYKDRKKTLSTQIAELRKFLEEHRPASRRLVPDGDPIPGSDAAGAGLACRPNPWRAFVVDDSQARPGPAEAVLSVPEIRDYRAINRELVRLLDDGCRAIRLTDANGQRLLVSGLAGSWTAAIEVTGDAGPELAAEMDAPNLTLVCRGSVGDGGASRLASGRVLIMGPAGPAFGYSQRGGLAMVAGTAGARAGLRQRGGDLILIGWTGPLCGECQSGGRLFTYAELGPHAGHGRRGGRFLHMDQTDRLADAEDRAAVASAFQSFRPWLGPTSDMVSAP